jgi:hypothetical protein
MSSFLPSGVAPNEFALPRQPAYLRLSLRRRRGMRTVLRIHLLAIG